MEKNRHLLVQWDYSRGEYQFCGHSVLTLFPGDKLRTKVHEYFKDFYGDEGLTSSKNCSYYEYNDGEVSIDDIRWQRVSDEELAVLNKLHL